MNSRDRSVRTIFGDGAAATWIAAEETLEEHVGPFVLGTDGSGADELIVRAGCFRNPVDESSSRAMEDSSGNVPI